MITKHQIKELAGVIASQAEAIENETVIGSLEAAAIRLAENATTLRIWIGMLNVSSELK